MSARAREGIHEFCHEHAITMAALFEALGELLANGEDDVVPAMVVERAAEIAKERRQRHPD